MAAATPAVYRTRHADVRRMHAPLQSSQPTGGGQDRIYRHDQHMAGPVIQAHPERSKRTLPSLSVMPFAHATMQASQNPPWPIPGHETNRGESRLTQDVHLAVDPAPALSGETPARFVLPPGALGLAARQNDGRIHPAAVKPFSASSSHGPPRSAIPAACGSRSGFGDHAPDPDEIPYSPSRSPAHRW